MPEGPLIAVVDDDSSIRNATQDLLKAAGYATVTFANAASFLDAPQRASVACLVADMRMPGMSGLELHEHLRSFGAAIPTVIVSAHLAELTAERKRATGISCFLSKPFKPDELLECVREAVVRSGDRRDIPRC
jgi:FixJ family two-component response regulator